MKLMLHSPCGCVKVGCGPIEISFKITLCWQEKVMILAKELSLVVSFGELIEPQPTLSYPQGSIVYFTLPPLPPLPSSN